MAFKEHSGVIVASVMCEGPDGMWFEKEILSTSFETASEELGRFVKLALSRSREGVEKLPEKEARALERSKYKAMGLKKSTEFDSGGRSVLLMEEEPGTLPFQPLQHLGSRRGWFANQNEDPPLVVSDGSDSEIGTALVQSLKHFDDR